MAKNKIADYSQTASDNTDIGGNSLLGSSSPRNLLLGLRELMKQLADWNAGTSPVDDTASSCDPDDDTKIFRFDAGNIAAGTSRVIDAEAVYDLSVEAEDIIALLSQRKAPILTYYTTAGAHTHTFNANTADFQVFGIGGGGGGGGAKGSGGSTQGSASGGNSGSYGWTRKLAKGELTTATIAIGSGGEGGTGIAPSNGSDGGNTTWSDGTNSYTWPGGKGGIAVTAGGQGVTGSPTTNAAFTGTIDGTYRQGSAGLISTGYATAVKGGDTPYGAGIYGSSQFNAGSSGQDGTGHGSGGGGGAVSGVSGTGTGGDGRLGLMIVVEW